MSIEMTHQILITQGPNAQVFNMKQDGVRLPNFGNRFTKLEYYLTNIYFFLGDSMF